MRKTTLIDLVGKRFGKFVVLERAGSLKRAAPTWRCQCDCGNIKVVRGACLRNGNSTSCGCSFAMDIVGQKFGRLTALKRDGSITHGNGRPAAAWLCKCDCGATTRVRGADLRNGNTKSCGCLLIEVRKTINRTHGQAGNAYTGRRPTPEYRTWVSAKNRCHNPDTPSYGNYGGRGIKVCERWINSFENFIADMGPKPGPDYSLDRIDVNGHYDPSNCRWATRLEQANNKRPRVRYKGLLASYLSSSL